MIGMEFENSRNWGSFRLGGGEFLETVTGLPWKGREGSMGPSCPHLQGGSAPPSGRVCPHLQGGPPWPEHWEGSQPCRVSSQSKERHHLGGRCVSHTFPLHRENARAFRHSPSQGPTHSESWSSISCSKHTEDL